MNKLEPLSAEKQGALLALLSCGFGSSEITRRTGVTNITIRKWQIKFVKNGWLREEKVDPDSHYTVAGHLLQHFATRVSTNNPLNGNPTLNEFRNFLKNDLVTPFESLLIEEFVHNLYLTAETGLEKLWVAATDITDKLRVEQRVHSIIHQMVWANENTENGPLYPSNKEVKNRICKEFRHAHHLPHWTERAKILSDQVKILTSLELRVVTHYYGLFNKVPLKAVDIARFLNKAESYVHRVHRSALTKLKSSVAQYGDVTFGSYIDYLDLREQQSKGVAGKLESLKDVQLNDLGFTTRTRNVLRRNSLTTLVEIYLAVSGTTKLNISGLAEKGEQEIRKKLEEYKHLFPDPETN